MRTGRRWQAPWAVLAAVVVATAGCGSWRGKIKRHEPLPEPPTGVSESLVAANEFIEAAVRAIDRHAEFPVTLVDERRKPELFKEAHVLYGASLDTFPEVLDQYLRARHSRVYSTRRLGGKRGEEPYLLVKTRLRVPEKVLCWLEVRRRPPGEARLAIIIDDVGNTRRGLAAAQDVPQGITFSVLPHTKYASECAEALHASGHTIMLHQPMEPLVLEDGNRLEPGPGAVLIGMAPNEIHQTVAGNLDAVPYVSAVNNHMGSRATADEATVRAVLAELREHGIPFVDSLTCSNSVCSRVAGELGVPCAVRNAAFLDNSRSRRDIRERLQEACQAARRTGLAIAIGHYHPAMLAELSDFDFGEVELVSVEALFRVEEASSGRE